MISTLLRSVGRCQLVRLTQNWVFAFSWTGCATFGEMAQFAKEMSGLGSANFLYSDGDTLFVHSHRRMYEENGGFSEARAPGLSMRNCVACQQGPEWQVDGCHIKIGKQKSVLFASVPLDETGWEALPEGTAIAVQGGVEVGRRAL